MVNWYFAYGSNMNPARARARGLPIAEIRAARLSDFRLVFNKRAHGKCGVAYANIAHAPGECAEGVAYALEDPAAIAVMDPFEGAPVRYSREVFRLETDAGPVAAWVYVANRAWIESGLLPERPYLEHLLAGADYLSPGYRSRIAAHPCLEVALPGHVQGLLHNG